ncbi:MgtC/SapB family protein [Vallitalea guaymasensis]|uniref:MgtC/SapB family protein n=1 Tax=Vallitalea guaymasensis TaxID=1185412 RepID=A0A8J8SD47_9FIRM|nr:MgtC/SapB family protein [Vallitalea guaymasensis]QUH30354.1 MgtC/SapB family protein [Vallitalea guaymasensis]
MEEYEVIIRIVIAILVGGLIGYERQITNRPAGFRTHILVCVGAAVVSIIQIESVERTIALIQEKPELANALKADIGRMGAQVITGVGFLGAGTIIREKGLVKGLTTAASIWVVACIGLAIGLGMYVITAASTIGVFISLVILKKVEDKFIDKVSTISLDIQYTGDKEFMKGIQKYFNMKNIKVRKIKFLSEESDLDETAATSEGEIIRHSIYSIDVPKYVNCTKIVQDLCRKKNIKQVKIL